ncbi:universal stress protein [Streptomyces sp. DW26H14]|uniref:universal stress protein n=1 Tax=Streptomyces sp. DW26H14 TaxID=3435395 RepID=UPI00403DF3FE
MARSIVVGVDGSPESLAAVEWAADEAVARQQPLRLLHAWGYGPAPNASWQAAESQRAWGNHFLDEALTRVRTRQPELEPEADLVPGAAAEVLESSDEETALLVLGSRGAGIVSGFLVGSVALGVVAAARCPVVLVRAAQPVPEGPNEGDVVLGVDLDHRTDALFEFSFEAARVRGSALTVVHAYPAPSPYGVAPGESHAATTSDMFAESYQRLLDALSPWQGKNPDIHVRPIAEAGHATPVLLDAARGASLCVIGRRERTRGPGPRLGAVDYGVMHHAACPVAVVPHA